MTLHVLNDLHLAAVRSGGTTPATAWQLRLDLLDGYRALLNQIDSDLLINGDFFDGADISKLDLLEALRMTTTWLVHTGHHLWLSQGNHDISRNSQNFSAFQFFANLLVGQFPGQVTLIAGGMQIAPNMYVLSHVVNQDLFDLELSKVPECEYLFVHANYNNGFAVESDHSLNMSEEQAKGLPVKHIVFGHEHQARTELGGKVVIVGNQQCSSIADCLNNDSKRMLKITDDGMEFIETWTAEGDFLEINWRSLSQGIADCIPERFIRVTGTAAADEAAAVVTAISRFRATAKALVITNAVKIEGMEDAEQLELSHEEITAFNVRDALRELLTDDENNKIDTLLSKKEDQSA